MSTLKRGARKALRPFVRPFLRPLLRRIDEVNDLAVRLDRHLPIIENAIESQNSELRSRAREGASVRAELQRLGDELAQARQEIEALRADVATAIAGGVRAAATSVAPVPQVRTLTGDADGDLRLDFGAGRPEAPGAAGAGPRMPAGADLAVRLRSLPFTSGSASEVRATLVLESYSLADLRDVVLPYWRSLLRPGGAFVVVAVDAEANLAAHRDGLLSFEELAAACFAAGAQPAAPRRSMLNEGVLRRLLEEAGFESVETVARWRDDDAISRIEVRGRRRGQVPMTIEASTRAGARA